MERKFIVFLGPAGILIRSEHHPPTDPLHDVKYLLFHTLVLLDVSMSSKEFSGELATRELSFVVWAEENCDK